MADVEPVLYVLDLDRTLIDVHKVMDLVRSICQKLDIDYSGIHREREEIEKRGSAYSPFNYIANNTDISIEEFKKRFISEGKKINLFFDDTAGFIEEVAKKKRDYMILTYGIDRDWQMLKLETANLGDVPYFITKNRYKSQFFTAHTNDLGIINPALAGLGKYESCVLVDDRDVAFKNFPKNCQGYLLKRGEEVPASPTQGNIKIINSLSEIDIV